MLKGIRVERLYKTEDGGRHACPKVGRTIPFPVRMESSSIKNGWYLTEALRLIIGHAGQVSCAPEGDIDYGHTKTIQRSRQENPANCLRHRGNHPDGRSDLRAFPAAARRTIGGPRHHLAGRGEARADAARGARIGDAGSRGDSLDPGADGLASGALGIASGGYRQAGFHHYGTE